MPFQTGGGTWNPLGGTKFTWGKIHGQLSRASGSSFKTHQETSPLLEPWTSPSNSPSKNSSKAQTLGKRSDSCQAGKGPEGGCKASKQAPWSCPRRTACMVLVELQTYQSGSEMRGKWGRGSGIVLPLRCLTSAWRKDSKLENTWADNKFTARTPSLPQAAG